MARLFYGGFGLTAIFLLGTAGINRTRGATWRLAIPAGYGLALAGSAILPPAAGRSVWHTLFGIEEDFEALVSPTHLMLGVGMALVVTGPLRAAWRRSAAVRLARPGAGTCLRHAAALHLHLFHDVLAPADEHYRRAHARGVQPGDGAGGWRAEPDDRRRAADGRRLPAAAAVDAAARRADVDLGANTVAMAIVNWEVPYAWTLLGAMFVAVLAGDWLLWRAQALLPSTRAAHLCLRGAGPALWRLFLALLQTEGRAGRSISSAARSSCRASLRCYSATRPGRRTSLRATAKHSL